VKESYEKIAQIFNESRRRPWHEALRLVEIEGDTGLTVDAGCGSGANAEYLIKRLRTRYVGIDVCFNMLKNLKKRCGEINVICGDIRMLPVRDNIATVVTCIATLHHIPSRENRIRAIYEMCRILRKSGRLVLTVWRVESKNRIRRYITLSSDSDLIVPWSWKLNNKVERYYHLYTRNELSEEIHKAKLIYRLSIRIVVSSVLKVGGYLNDVAMVLRLE